MPNNTAARNNLANVLAEQGCYGSALVEARAALAATEPDDTLYAAIADTLASVEAAAARAPTASAGCR
jgi:hypothetical protein